MKVFIPVLLAAILWTPFYATLHIMDGHEEVRVFGNEKDDDLPLCYYKGSNRCSPKGTSFSLFSLPGLVPYHIEVDPLLFSTLPRKKVKPFIPSPAGEGPFRPPSPLL